MVKNNDKATVEKRNFSATIVYFLNFLLNLIQQILLVPVFLDFWGKEVYGIWGTLLAFSALVRSISAGHGQFIGNEFCKLYEVDKIKLSNTLSTSLTIDLLINLFLSILVALFVISGLFKKHLNFSTYLINQYHIESSFIIVSIFWMLGTSSVGILSLLYLPAGLQSRYAWWGIVASISYTIAIIFSMLLGGKILLASVSITIITLFISILRYKESINYLKEFYPFWGKVNWKLGISNFTKSLVYVFYGLLAEFRNSGVSLQVSAILGASFLPNFLTIKTLSNALIQVTNVITNPVKAELVRYHSIKSHHKLLLSIYTIWMISCLLVNSFSLLSLPVILPLYKTWTNNHLTLDFPLYLALSLSLILKTIGTPIIIYLNGINHLKSQLLISAIQTIIVIGGSSFSLNSIGLVGVGISIALGELLGSIIIPLIIFNKNIKSMGGKIKITHLLLVFCSAFVTATVYLLIIYFHIFTFSFLATFSLIGTLIIIVIHVFQFYILPQEIKSRLLSLVFRN